MEWTANSGSYTKHKFSFPGHLSVKFSLGLLLSPNCNAVYLVCCDSWWVTARLMSYSSMSCRPQIVRSTPSCPVAKLFQKKF